MGLLRNLDSEAKKRTATRECTHEILNPRPNHYSLCPKLLHAARIANSPKLQAFTFGWLPQNLQTPTRNPRSL